MTSSPEVLVIDYGSRFYLLLTRRIRDQGAYSEVVSPPERFIPHDYPQTRAIILVGDNRELGDSDPKPLPAGLLESGIPIMGVGYGAEILSHHLALRLDREALAGRGPVPLNDTPHWVNVQDCVRGDERTLSGLREFLRTAGCPLDWDAKRFIDEAINSIRLTVGTAKVCCALSGGVDSTVAATLVNRAIGDQLTCLFVDNGLLRHQESERVLTLMKEIDVKVERIDARELFLERLSGISDPEAKRKVIGHTFIEVFENAVKDDDVTFLVQGTLYPDIVESGSGKNNTIKSHHNVGGLPEDMTFELLEPLRELFKDEVRKVGTQLGLPDSVVLRQPFPGPGMAVRVLGEVTEKRLRIARAADHIATTEIEKALTIGERPWQYYAALLPVSAVGMIDGERRYGEAIALRAVASEDAMAAQVCPLNWDLLNTIAVRIINEVVGISRVVYDVTPKPPGTIEWE